MSQSPSNPDDTATAPQGVRDALAELVQIGLRVARMVGRIAEAETELAEAASRAGVDPGVPALATSLAKTIEADRAATAAAEIRQTAVARTEAVAAAFARVSRAVRVTIALAERLDRGWARRGEADNRHAKVLRQIASGVADAMGREADGVRTPTLTGSFADQLEALDTEDELGDRSAEAIIGAICRDLGLDPAQMLVRSPLLGIVRFAEAHRTAPLTAKGSTPPQRRPDG